MRRHLLLAAACLAGAAPVAAQDLAGRILAIRDGTARLTFASREGLCGDGESYIRDRSRGENHYMQFDGRGRGWRTRTCDEGPARVAITMAGGSVRRVRVFVGGSWAVARPGEDAVRDFGVVGAPEAARALLEVARRDRRGEEAVFAATVADSIPVWPELLALAKDDRAVRATRKSAVFWLSQYASDAASKGLSELVEDDTEDREVRDQAVFALSQLGDDRGVPILIRIARSNRDPAIRRKAIFWLGQSDDPRARALFEEILTRG